MGDLRLLVHIRRPDAPKDIEYVLKTAKACMTLHTKGEQPKIYTPEAHLFIGRPDNGQSRDIPIYPSVSEYAKQVSRNHGEIWQSKDGTWFYKNNSTKGTFIRQNGQLTDLKEKEEIILNDGTQLNLGKLTNLIYAVTITVNI